MCGPDKNRWGEHVFCSFLNWAWIPFIFQTICISNKINPYWITWRCLNYKKIYKAWTKYIWNHRSNVRTKKWWVVTPFVVRTKNCYDMPFLPRRTLTLTKLFVLKLKKLLKFKCTLIVILSCIYMYVYMLYIYNTYIQYKYNKYDKYTI